MQGNRRIGRTLSSEGWRRFLPLALLAWTGAHSNSASPDTLTFDSSPYKSGATINNLDSWHLSNVQGGNPDAFMVGPLASNNLGVQINTAGLNTIYRLFNASDNQTLETRWRWKMLDSNAHVCLGLAGDESTARASLQGVGCFAPKGVIEGADPVPFASAEKWTANKWYFMRIRGDWQRRKWSLYVASDSLRGNEHVAYSGNLPTAAGNGFTRVVLFTLNGSGSALLDDIAWEPFHQWQAHTSQAYWSQSGNWSRGVVPDARSPVVFNDASTLTCILDRNVSVNSIFLEKAYGGTLNLQTYALTVTGSRGDFTGLGSWVVAGNGRLEFAGARQSLTSPAAKTLPPVLHSSGSLRMNGRRLAASSFYQTAGTLDMAGYDAFIDGDFMFLKGDSLSLTGLDGVTLSARHRLYFEGVSEKIRIGLKSDSLPWSAFAGDSLVAKFADIRGSIADSGDASRPGLAVFGNDGGGNVNWVFSFPPVFSAQPQSQSLKVGEEAVFRVSVKPAVATHFKWYRDGVYINGIDDSVLAQSRLTRSDSGRIFTCAATNFLGTTGSSVATLSVAFPAPRLDPAAAAFSDSIDVKLTSPVTGASLIYFRDGQGPLVPGPARVVTLKASGSLKVLALLGPDTSLAAFGNYVKQPKADPPAFAGLDSIFIDTIQVAFLAPPAGASIRYTRDGSLPDTSKPLYDGKPITLSGTTTFRAVITRAGYVNSDPVSRTFIRNSDGPQAIPPGASFPNTVKVTLVAKPGSTAHYTLDGSTPGAGSPTATGPITLDSTVTLHAIYLGAGQSGVSTFDFSLVPDNPTATPGGGSYEAGMDIVLRTSTSKARIYYTLDGSDPAPGAGPWLASGASFHLDTSATLRALAVTGQGETLRGSDTLAQTYVFTSAAPHELAPGRQLGLGGAYTLANGGSASVTVTLLRPDSLKVAGFEGLSGFRISPAQGSAVPPLALSGPAAGGKLLYRIDASGKPRFLDRGDSAHLAAAGDYFLGLDTLPPRILLAFEKPLGDSTWLGFAFEENTSDMLVDLERSDKPGLGFTQRLFGAGDTLKVALKNPPGDILPLDLRVKAFDRVNASAFPANPAARYPVSQTIEGGKSPSLFHIGEAADQPWDLVGIPLPLDTPLTLESLRRGSAADLEAETLDPGAETYHALPANGTLPAGRAVWLGRGSGLQSLTLPPLRTAAQGADRPLHVTLSHGWNLVANPGLQVLYWPVTRKDPERHALSEYKGLRGYDLASRDFVFSDSLLPWRGYLAYYRGDKDTAVELLPVPPLADVSAKRSAAAPRAGLALALALKLGRAPSLHLGTAAAAREGADAEDEPQLPAPGESGAKLWSARDGRRLGTDLLPFRPDGVSRWRVAAFLPASERNLQGTQASGVEIRGLDLPGGMEAWAVSRRRGLKFPLLAGGAIPMQPGTADTLEVYAGPAGLVRSALAEIPVSAGPFRAELLRSQGGYVLSLRVSESLDLRWEIASLDGSVRERSAASLTEGIYRLPLGAGRAGPAGIYLLRAEWSGRDGTGRLIRKLALP
jgi:hypothetical protein